MQYRRGETTKTHPSSKAEEAKNKSEVDEETEEKRRRQAFKEEQELRAFEERGGFGAVLRDLFRPTGAGGADLDSVH